ncbi:MAG: threonine/serine exporter family protein [Vicinamibacterales bacterium]
MLTAVNRQADGPAPGREPSGPSAPVEDEAAAFVLKLGRALHAHGYSADRLEGVLDGVCVRLGLEGQFFSTPTSIFASFGPERSQRTHMIRVQPGATNLGRLSRLDAITREVMSGRVSPAEGSERIDVVLASPAPYSSLTAVGAFGLASGAACRFLGGGWMEMLVSAAVGLVVGVLARGFGPRPRLSRLFEMVAAGVGAFLVSAIGTFVGGFSTFTATLGGLLVLLPGFTVTVAMTELASQHLSSGTARLSGAFTIFLSITFGVLVGSQAAAACFGVPPIVTPVAPPWWTEWAAVLLIPLALTVLLQAEARDIGWVVLSAVVAFVSLRAGAFVLGTALGAFTGALVIGVASDLFERRVRRLGLIPLVPGVMLLVPGSLGYRSLASLVERNVVGGVEAGFSMMLTGAGLVAGLLIANVLVPAREPR